MNSNDTNNSICGFCFSEAVVDIRTHGMQRHTTFAVTFDTRNISAAEVRASIDRKVEEIRLRVMREKAAKDSIVITLSRLKYQYILIFHLLH